MARGNQQQRGPIPDAIFEEEAPEEQAGEAPAQPADVSPEMLGMARAAVPKKAPAKVKIKQYRVDNDDQIGDRARGLAFMYRGSRTQIRKGKIIDERHYDLAALRAQGALLTEVGEIEA